MQAVDEASIAPSVFYRDKVTYQQQPAQIQAEMHQKNPST